jgi:hypothetical protein
VGQPSFFTSSAFEPLSRTSTWSGLKLIPKHFSNLFENLKKTHVIELDTKTTEREALLLRSALGAKDSEVLTIYWVGRSQEPFGLLALLTTKSTKPYWAHAVPILTQFSPPQVVSTFKKAA